MIEQNEVITDLIYEISFIHQFDRDDFLQPSAQSAKKVV